MVGASQRRLSPKKRTCRCERDLMEVPGRYHELQAGILGRSVCYVINASHIAHFSTDSL